MAGSLWDVKRERTGLEFVDAALELFETKGYERTTVAEVCAAATQSRSTFFRYFGSKEDVLFHGVQEDLELVKVAIADRLRTGTEPWTAVTQACIEMMESTYHNGDRARKLLRLWQNEPALRARWTEHSTRWESAIADVVASSRHNRTADDPYAQIVAMAAVGSVRVAVTSGHDLDGDFFDYIAGMYAIFEGGIGAKAGDQDPAGTS